MADGRRSMGQFASRNFGGSCPTISSTVDARFLELLAAALPSGSVVRDPSELLIYESDALVHLRSTPGAVVLPRSAAEVQAVVRLCHEHGVPFVARGHGTGLSGGALPHPQGVLIVLSRLNRIVDVDTDNLRVTVEPGVTNLEITKRVAPLGLLLRARPVEPERLLDRRQHRRELRRRALPEVRLHRPSRPRCRGGAAERRPRQHRAARRSTHQGSTCSASSSAPRARSASSRRPRCGCCRSPRRC